MKIISIEINCLRGIKNLKLNLNGENAVVYGDNGTGKSGVIDSIDFLVKGEISRLSGSGTKNLSLENHGKYVTENIDNAWVKAQVKLPNYDEIITIQRYLKNPSVLICDKKYIQDFLDIKNIAELQAHYLSRREILQFINSTDQKRAENIEKILNLRNLDKNRTILQKIVKKFKDRLSEKISNEGNYVNNLSETLKAPEDKWLEEINTLREQLGAKELNSLGKDNISSELSLVKTTIPQAELTNLIQQMKNIIDSFGRDKENIYVLLNQTKIIFEQIKITQDYQSIVNMISLIDNGEKLFKDGKCPLCEQEIRDTTVFFKNLEQRKKKLRGTKDLLSDFHKKINTIQGGLEKVKSAISFVDKNTLSKYADVSFLNDTETKIIDFLANIRQKSLDFEEIDKFLESDIPMVIKVNYLDILSEKLLSISIKRKESFYQTLVDVNSKYNLLLEVRNEIKLVKKRYNILKCLFDVYVVSQTKVLNDLYDSIQDRFSSLYKIIHAEDEKNFVGKLEREKSTLNMQVKFKDGKMYPPNAVHSEGHQDSMGICLFFALSEKISNEKLNFILLDDVVMSIDIDHRKHFCELLKEEFSNKQFIITTHDYIWRKEMENLGVVKKNNIIHFKSWSIEHGPYVEIGCNIWDCINGHLKKGEKNEAIGLMRYYMEEFFSDICSEYRLKVPYSVTGRWSLEDVLSPVNSFYRKAIKKAKESANSYNKDLTNIKKYEERYNNACKNLQVEKWTINPSTHFTLWAQDLSIDELKNVCNAVKEYCDSFICQNCQSLIKINADINLEPESICCNCGDYSYSCVKKK